MSQIPPELAGLHLLRPRHLKKLGIADSYRSLVRDRGFPPGFKPSPGVRAWTVESVQKWIASRPTFDNAPLKGAARRRAEAARSAEHIAQPWLRVIANRLTQIANGDGFETAEERREALRQIAELILTAADSETAKKECAAKRNVEAAQRRAVSA
jgi:hypothetical protein